MRGPSPEPRLWLVSEMVPLKESTMARQVRRMIANCGGQASMSVVAHRSSCCPMSMLRQKHIDSPSPPLPKAGSVPTDLRGTRPNKEVALGEVEQI